MQIPDTGRSPTLLAREKVGFVVGETGNTRPILVVDDDPQLRGALARILRGEGHEVLEAADGEEGEKKERKKREGTGASPAARKKAKLKLAAESTHKLEK